MMFMIGHGPKNSGTRLIVHKAGFRCRVSGVNKQMTEDRKQNSERVLHLPVFAICLLSSDLCPLKPEH
jgi:hypothetical protein